jgi:hypothetical protein
MNAQVGHHPNHRIAILFHRSPSGPFQPKQSGGDPNDGVGSVTPLGDGGESPDANVGLHLGGQIDLAGMINPEQQRLVLAQHHLVLDGLNASAPELVVVFFLAAVRTEVRVGQAMLREADLGGVVPYKDVVLLGGRLFENQGY